MNKSTKSSQAAPNNKADPPVGKAAQKPVAKKQLTAKTSTVAPIMGQIDNLKKNTDINHVEKGVQKQMSLSDEAPPTVISDQPVKNSKVANNETVLTKDANAPLTSSNNEKHVRSSAHATAAASHVDVLKTEEVVKTNNLPNLQPSKKNKVGAATPPEDVPITSDVHQDTPKGTQSQSSPQAEHKSKCTTTPAISNTVAAQKHHVGSPIQRQSPVTPPNISPQRPAPKHKRFCKLHNSLAHDHAQCNVVKTMQRLGRPMPWEVDPNWVYRHYRAASPKASTARLATNQSGDVRNHVATGSKPPSRTPTPEFPVFGPPLPLPHLRRSYDKTPSPEKELMTDREVRTNWLGKPVDAVATHRWVMFTQEQTSPKTKAIMPEVADDAKSSSATEEIKKEVESEENSVAFTQTEVTDTEDVTSPELLQHSNTIVDTLALTSTLGEMARSPTQHTGSSPIAVGVKPSPGLPVNIDISNIQNQAVMVSVEMVDGMTVQVKVAGNSTITITKGVAGQTTSG